MAIEKSNFTRFLDCAVSWVQRGRPGGDPHLNLCPYKLMVVAIISTKTELGSNLKTS